MLKWRRWPAWCRLGAAREGGLNPCWMRWYSTATSEGIKGQISWSYQVPSCRFSTAKEVQLPCTKPHWVISDVNMGIFTSTSWKWDIASDLVKSSPQSIARSDKLSCNINIFLVVSWYLRLRLPDMAFQPPTAPNRKHLESSVGTD